ncbi:MAG: ABC transporter permease, partial [Anaerolineae bacterium]
MKHTLAVARKEVHHILRDRSTLFLVLFTPTLLLLFFSYALTVDIQHVEIAVLDHDRSPASQRFIQQITAGSDLDLYAQVDTFDELDRLLIEGKIKAAVIIGPEFSSDLLALRGTPLQVLIDGTEPESGGFAVDHIARRAETFVTEALGTQLAAQGLSAAALSPLDIRVRAWFNPGLKPRNDIIPGLMSMVLGMPALSVALAIAHEREHGTLEQLMATPIGRAELLVGKMLPYLVVGLVNVVLMPALAIALFHIRLNGSFLLFFLLSAVFLFSILSMGILMGVFMKTQAAALALSFLMIFYPGFFMTGIFFPLNSMPEIVRLEAMFLPGTPYATITRGIFLPALGLDVLWPYAIMLLFQALMFTGIAA